MTPYGGGISVLDHTPKRLSKKDYFEFDSKKRLSKKDYQKKTIQKRLLKKTIVELL